MYQPCTSVCSFISGVRFRRTCNLTRFSIFANKTCLFISTTKNIHTYINIYIHTYIHINAYHLPKKTRHFSSDMQRLEMLHELNIAGNKLKHLPEALARLPELRVLRAHSNVLRYLPDFGRAHNLKVRHVDFENAE